MFNKDKNIYGPKQIGNEIVINLPLQMVLYFNCIFLPFWLLIMFILLSEKFHTLHGLYQLILTIVIVILTPMECFRLYFGIVGNLLEKIPEFAGFWMLTLFLQFPLQVFVLISMFVAFHPAGQAMQVIMCAMLMIQIILGFFTFKDISNQRANKFHLMRMRLNSSYYFTRNMADNK